MDPVPPTPTPDWLLLVYLSEQGGLRQTATRVIKELEQANLGAHAACAYQFAGLDGTTRGFFRVGDGWNTLNLPRIDVTKPEELTAFVNWAQDEFSTRHTALVLKDHGTGWQPINRKRRALGNPHNLGIMLNEGKYMSTPALRAAVASTRRRINLLGLDACNMAALEVAYELRKSVDFMVATYWTSETKGWNYERLAESVAGKDAPGPRELARLASANARQAEDGNPYVALELVWMDRLAKSFQNVAAELGSNQPNFTEWSTTDPRFNVESGNVTLDDFIAALKEMAVNPDELKSALERATVWGQGVTVFLPSQGGFSDVPSYGSVEFGSSGSWVNLLGSLNADLISARQSRASMIPGTTQ